MSSNTKSTSIWSYENLSEWPKYFPCTKGSLQSPINIITQDTIPEFYSSFLFSSKYNADELFILNYNGQQITVTLPKCPTTEHNSSEFYFTGSNLTGKYHFINFHLHWGQSNDHGSEHEIDGHRFPAEAHFVHKNYDNGQIVVLAFLLTIDNSNNEQHNEWEKYGNIGSQLTKSNNQMNCIFNLSQLMQIKDKEFFRYTGSLTTPPCTEGVIWTVFSHKTLIKAKTLNLLRENIMRKAYRPVQPTNGRIIFRSYQ